MQKIQTETLDDNIYYDLTIINNTNKSVPTKFNQTLINTVVDNPHDYYMSCVRFFLDTSSLPIFLFKDNEYWVSIENVGTSTINSQPVIYVPSFPNPTIESYPEPIYSYQDFIDMINTALATANTAAGTGLNPPYMYYNCTSGLISMLAPTGFATITGNFNIYFNTTLAYFFDNVQTYYYGEGLLTHLDVRWIIKNIGSGQNTSALNSSIPAGYYQMSQEYVSLNKWKGASSIAFKSNRTGIRNSYSTGINNSSIQNSTVSAGAGLPTTQIMTDFIPYIASNDAAGWRGNLLYTPTSQYRLIDLLGNTLNAIDVEVVWRDQQNNEFPVLNLPGTQASIKLIFVKKSLYKNYIQTGFDPKK
jgi:hypothetical protein